MRNDLGIHTRLADAPRDKLRVLGAKVNDKYWSDGSWRSLFFHSRQYSSPQIGSVFATKQPCLLGPGLELSGPNRRNDTDAITMPAPPLAITLPNSSSVCATPSRST